MEKWEEVLCAVPATEQLTNNQSSSMGWLWLLDKCSESIIKMKVLISKSAWQWNARNKSKTRSKQLQWKSWLLLLYLHIHFYFDGKG
jgi:hypothetical protein